MADGDGDGDTIRARGKGKRWENFGREVGCRFRLQNESLSDPFSLSHLDPFPLPRTLGPGVGRGDVK